MTNNLLYLAPSALGSLQLLSIDEAQSLLSIGRTKLYELISNGDIKPLKLGRRSLIRASDLQAFIAALPTAGGTQ